MDPRLRSMKWTLGLREQIEAERSKERVWRERMTPLMESLRELDPDGWARWFDDSIDDHATRDEIHDIVMKRIAELLTRQNAGRTIQVSKVSLHPKDIPVRTLEEP
jgi:hypothetical protein